MCTCGVGGSEGSDQSRVAPSGRPQAKSGGSIYVTPLPFILPHASAVVGEGLRPDPHRVCCPEASSGVERLTADGISALGADSWSGTHVRPSVHGTAGTPARGNRSYPPASSQN